MNIQLKNYFALLIVLSSADACLAQFNPTNLSPTISGTNLNSPLRFTNKSDSISQLRILLKNTNKNIQLKDLQATDEVQEIKYKSNNNLKVEGGISDGGGNAVGPTLFDFYENQGSLSLKPSQILNWNQETQNLIQKANSLLPKIGRYSKRGLGDELILSIQSKKWIIETKDITKDSCKNESMIQVINQKIVGCQNFYEVRLSADWLVNIADEKNQSGLIIHEALLAWVRNLDKGTIKSDSEFKVREVNRLLHSDLKSEDFVNEIKKLIPDEQYYHADENNFIRQLPIKSLEIRQNFCENKSKEDYAQVMSFYKNYPALNKNIDEEFKQYVELARLYTRMESIKRTNQDSANEYQKNFDLIRQDYCKKDNSPFPDVSTLKFKPELIQEKDCKKGIEDAFSQYINIADTFKHQTFEIEKTGAQRLLHKEYLLVKIAANACAIMKIGSLANKLFATEADRESIAKETQLQAIKYFTILKDDYDKNN